MTTTIHISRCETGGMTFGSPPITQYAVCVNGAVVSNYVPVESILAVANIAFEAAQAVDFNETVKWDSDDQLFLTRLFQEHESHETRNKQYS